MVNIERAHQRGHAHPLYYLPANAESMIDVGCNAGVLLADAHSMGITRSLGIDINANAIAQAKQQLAQFGTAAEAIHSSADAIPAADGTFDVATCCEVIEHVPEQLRAAVFREVHRVLKPGGTFILTTPAAGLFAFLDPSNMRFRFSGLYRHVNRLIGGGGRDAGYEGQKHGVVWHEHFPIQTLQAFLSPRFDIQMIRFRGALLLPLCETALFPFYRRGRLDAWPARAINRLKRFERQRNLGRFLGYNVMIIATSSTKRTAPSEPAIPGKVDVETATPA